MLWQRTHSGEVRDAIFCQVESADGTARARGSIMIWDLTNTSITNSNGLAINMRGIRVTTTASAVSVMAAGILETASVAAVAATTQHQPICLLQVFGFHNAITVINGGAQAAPYTITTSTTAGACGVRTDAAANRFEIAAQIGVMWEDAINGTTNIGGFIRAM